MATGPEHYREAEEHVGFAMATSLDSEARFHLAAAQVHATLALAAATALGSRHDMYDLDFEAWDRVAGVQDDEDEDGDEPELDTEESDRPVELFVDVADAERNAQRDEYVNSPLDAEETEAEWQAAKDAEAADDAMSASERFEHDQADEARIDAESEAGR